MFTQDQLLFIQECARKRKNQGERSVFNLAIESSNNFTREQINILDYISAECVRQHSKEMSVYWLADAWTFASTATGSIITIGFIEKVGKIVEPIKNAKGFRTVAVGIYEQEDSISRVEGDRREFSSGWVWKEKAQWERVPFLLQTLIDAFNDGNLDWHYKEHRPSNPLAKDGIDQFYYEYEEIHPFVDGNGRSGKVIYNWMRGTLDNPVMPPTFWDTSAP